MQTRILGKTDLELPVLGFGASSLGQEFRPVTVSDALESVRVALDCGLSFIDTSPFYGRGMSEVLLGIALRGVPRDRIFRRMHRLRPHRTEKVMLKTGTFLVVPSGNLKSRLGP